MFGSKARAAFSVLLLIAIESPALVLLCLDRRQGPLSQFFSLQMNCLRWCHCDWIAVRGHTLSLCSSFRDLLLALAARLYSCIYSIVGYIKYPNIKLKGYNNKKLYIVYVKVYMWILKWLLLEWRCSLYFTMIQNTKNIWIGVTIRFEGCRGHNVSLLVARGWDGETWSSSSPNRIVVMIWTYRVIWWLLQLLSQGCRSYHDYSKCLLYKLP